MCNIHGLFLGCLGDVIQDKIENLDKKFIIINWVSICPIIVQNSKWIHCVESIGLSISNEEIKWLI
jgi:hypothetical protein